MKNFLLTCLIGGTLVGSLQVSQAVVVTTTFAQFNETVSNKPFTYVGRDPFNQSNPGTSDTSTLNATTGVTFKYLDFLLGTKNGFHPTLGTNYTGTLTFFGSNSQGGANNDTPFDVTQFSFIADGSAVNASAGITSGTVLLRGRSGDPTFDGTTGTGGGAAGDFVARQGQSGGNFNASNVNGQTSNQPQFVSFSSDVINTTGIFTENYALSFSAIVPGINYGPLPPANPNRITDPFLRNFTADASGTFGAQFNSVPEPGAYALLGSLLAGSAFGLRRRRNRK